MVFHCLMNSIEVLKGNGEFYRSSEGIKFLGSAVLFVNINCYEVS